MFETQYANVFEGDEQLAARSTSRRAIATRGSETSTYVKNPPYFEGMTMTPPGVRPITGARALGMLGDSITTDHISPAGNIAAASPAGQVAHRARRADEGLQLVRRAARQSRSDDARHVREHPPAQRARAAATKAGGRRRSRAASRVRSTTRDGVPAAAARRSSIIAGKEYGTGSSRDWAAKGTLLLGVRAVIAESFERIHRSNLVGMGVLPLEFTNGETRQSLGLTGFETFDIEGLDDDAEAARDADGHARRRPTAAAKTFKVARRIDTPEELSYYKHGGILPYVLRQLVGGRA